MTRQVSQHWEEVPADRVLKTVTTYQCDGCDREISPDDYEDMCANELIITLNEEQCVNFFRRRDYCSTCLEPVWQAVNQLIGADPDLERDREYSDR